MWVKHVPGHDLFNPEFDAVDGEPHEEHFPDERLFDNPNGSLESEGEIDIPQMTSADSDSDSDSDSSDDDDEPGYQTRSSTRTTRQSQQTPRTQTKRGSDATKRGSLTPINLFDEESKEDSDPLNIVPPPPSRSERHVVIEGEEEFQEWPQLSSPKEDGDNLERPLIDIEDDDPDDSGLLDPA